MLVRVNPERLAADENFRVTHPDSKRPFPSPDPFEMSDTDLQHPRIVRLFPPAGEPGGIAGGVFGDLVAVTSPTPKKKG